MTTPRRPLFDNAQIELGLLPVVALAPSAPSGIMVGTAPVQQIRWGTVVVNKVYVATTQIWPTLIPG